MTNYSSSQTKARDTSQSRTWGGGGGGGGVWGVWGGGIVASQSCTDEFSAGSR